MLCDKTLWWLTDERVVASPKAAEGHQAWAWGHEDRDGICWVGSPLPSQLGVWVSVVSCPIGVRGARLPGMHFWHFWVTARTLPADSKMWFFAQCNAQNWRICIKTMWKDVGVKSGECLRENCESWALHHYSHKNRWLGTQVLQLWPCWWDSVDHWNGWFKMHSGVGR